MYGHADVSVKMYLVVTKTSPAPPPPVGSNSIASPAPPPPSTCAGRRPAPSLKIGTSPTPAPPNWGIPGPHRHGHPVRGENLPVVTELIAPVIQWLAFPTSPSPVKMSVCRPLVFCRSSTSPNGSSGHWL